MGLLTSFCLLGSGFGSILVGELLLHFEYQSVFRIGAALTLMAVATGWKRILILLPRFYQNSSVPEII
jgi:predicted MFS family arabinose efflux permease